MMNVRGIKKVVNPAVGLTLLVLAVLAVTAVTAAPPPPDADGKFSLFGNAQWVVGGLTPPGEKAIDLTSNCGAEPYNAVCYQDATFTYSGVAFTPKSGPGMTLADITTLSTAYNMNGTDCSGGSPRFVIDTSSGNNFVVNIGHPPYGGDCYYGWQNTGNVTSTSDPTLRWQVNLANTFVAWSDVLAAHGSEQVTEIDVVLDGGWIAARGQDVTIDGFTVNKKMLHP